MVAALHPVRLKLSKKHANTLRKSGHLNIKPAEIHGNHVTFLSRAHIAKIGKNARMGKSTKIKLTKHEIRTNVIHGSGFFGNLLKSAANIAKPLAGQVLRNLGNKAVQYIGSKAGDLLGSDSLGKKVASTGNQIINSTLKSVGVGKAHRKYSHSHSMSSVGYGRKKINHQAALVRQGAIPRDRYGRLLPRSGARRKAATRGRKKRGKGFFDGILRGALQGALGGGRRRRKVGASFDL